MNIYDEANKFADVLKQSTEIEDLHKCVEKIKNNDTNKKMVQDFRNVQMEAYTEQMQQGKISDETKKKFENLGAIISMNPEVAAYIQAEQKFSVMWNDILKIFNDAIGLDFSL